MFKLKVDLEAGVIAAEGSTIEIATDILFLISELHSRLAAADAQYGELFKCAICAGVTPDSPVFSQQPSPGVGFVIRKQGGSDD